jgi:hypothetical protein
MRRSSRSPRPGAIALACVVTLAGCVGAVSPNPDGSPTDRPTATATLAPSSTATLPPTADAAKLETSKDGITLRATVDPITAASGGKVAIEVTLTNGRSTPLEHGQDPCGWFASVWVELRQPFDRPGIGQTGLAGAFKRFELTKGLAPGVVPAEGPLRADVTPGRCPETTVGNGLTAWLAPGRSTSLTYTWPVELTRGVPMLPGDVPLTVEAGYDPDWGPSPTPIPSGQVGSSHILVMKQLKVSASIHVTGDRGAFASAAEAVDVLLGDAGFRRWLGKLPASTWSGGNIFLTNGGPGSGIVPAGPSWDIELFREVDTPRNWAIAFVEPFKSTVRSITYCDIPCDR